MIRCWFWVFLILLYSPNFDFDHEPISEVLQITSVNTFLMAEHILLQIYAALLFACWKLPNTGHTIALHRASWVLSAIVRKKKVFLINAIQLDWSLAHFSFVFSFGTRPGRFDIAKMHHNGILLPKLFWPTVRKNCFSDREKVWNSRLKAKNLQNFWDH